MAAQAKRKDSTNAERQRAFRARQRAEREGAGFVPDGPARYASGTMTATVGTVTVQETVTPDPPFRYTRTDLDAAVEVGQMVSLFDHVLDDDGVAAANLGRWLDSGPRLEWLFRSQMAEQYPGEFGEWEESRRRQGARF